MPRLKLTERTLKALKPPNHGSQDYWDTTQKNFGVRITSSGRLSFFAFYRFHRIKRRMTLGTFPLLSLSRARENAREVLGQAAGQRDPAKEKLLAKRASVFAVLAAEYMEKHAKKHKRSWRSDARLLKSELLPRWKALPVAEITRADVRAMLDQIVDRGAPILANRTLALARKIFNFAIEHDWPIPNPCVGIRRPAAETERARVLTPDELKRVWDALDAEDPFFAALYRLRLLTAQRGGEVRQMRWDQIDFERAVWTIPAEIAKNNHAHRVPLSEPALRVLESLRQWQDERRATINAGRRKKAWPLQEASVFVFPSSKLVDRPIEWVQRVNARVRQTANVDFRPHDLRRTAATSLEELGVMPHVISKILNHRTQGVTKVYARYGYEREKRAAMERWGREVERILSGREGAKVFAVS